MEFKSREREINLRTLIFSILRRWRAMVIASLVFALGLGAFQCYRTWNGINDPEKLAIQREDYKKALQDYERQVYALQVKLENAERDRRELQDYLGNSALMRLDPRNVYQANLSLFISEKVSGNASLTSLTDAMVVAYETALKDHDLMSDVATNLEMDTKYLQELVSVSSGNSGDKQSHILTITVIHSSREGAEQIMDLIQGHISTISRDVRRNIGEHSVNVVADSIGVIVDFELAELQNAESERLSQYTAAGEAAQKELNALKQPAEPALSSGAVIKNTLLYGAIGAVIGVFLVIVVICIAYVTGDRIHSGEEIKETFRINLLGELSLRSKPRKGIDGWLDQAEGRTAISQSVWQEMTAINIRNFSVGRDNLLIVSSCDDGTVQSIAEMVQGKLPGKNILVGGNLLNNASALEKLPDCDGVILLERSNISRYSQVTRHVELIQNMGKALIGAIILEA